MKFQIHIKDGHFILEFITNCSQNTKYQISLSKCVQKGMDRK